MRAIAARVPLCIVGQSFPIVSVCGRSRKPVLCGAVAIVGSGRVAFFALADALCGDVALAAGVEVVSCGAVARVGSGRGAFFVLADALCGDVALAAGGL